MPNLKKNLENELKTAGRILVLGVGSEFRGDDIAGLLVARKIKNKIKKCRGEKVVKVLEGGTAPENLTGEIIKFKPRHVIIVDSADFGARAGTVKFLSGGEIEGVSFSTHVLPLKILAAYLERTAGCRVTIIGIQPKNLDFDAPTSGQVKKAVKNLSKNIFGIIGK